MTLGTNVHLLPQTNHLRALHTIIRDKYVTRADFVFYSRRIIRLLLEAGMDLLPFDKHKVTTPIGETYEGLRLGSKLCGVAVVRAGESMEVELREVRPSIRIGKILIQRDRQTKLPHLYYSSLPADIAGRHVLLLEPMLATGGSALAAIDVLRRAGVAAEKIILINFLASSQGILAVSQAHPTLKMVTSSIEDGLNQDAYMMPGIGDFGDRYFGTTSSGPK
ncbi:MAG TPA: uracil phosphoribosyltransferase [Micromonospora sp.]|nr:uracil phosphoribosyltransferase [Micromonospora sp.]